MFNGILENTDDTYRYQSNFECVFSKIPLNQVRVVDNLGGCGYTGG